MKQNTIGRIYKYGVVLAFLAILILPIITLSSGNNSNTENRRLAMAPQLVVNGKLNANLAKETENWLRDRFGGRDILLWVNSKAEAAIGDWSSPRALRGKDGWLFYKDEGSIETFNNKNLFTQAELESIRDGIHKKQAMLKSAGVDHYYLVICPDKNRIYGEDFYPDYILQGEARGPKSRAQQLVEFLEAAGDINVVYPAEALNAAKNAHPEQVLYYRTDTHWNTHGGFIAYQKLMKAIQKDYPGLKSLDETDFVIEHSAPEPGCDADLNWQVGDLLRMFNGRSVAELGIKDNYVDRLKPRNGDFNFKYVKFSQDEGRRGVISANPDSMNHLNAVVYRDSFGKALVPYISESFMNVEYIWSHSFARHFKTVQKNKPNIVIEEIVERNLQDLIGNADK